MFNIASGFYVMIPYMVSIWFTLLHIASQKLKPTQLAYTAMAGIIRGLISEL